MDLILLMFIMAVLTVVSYKIGFKTGENIEKKIWKDRIESLKKMYDTTIEDLTTGEKEN